MSARPSRNHRSHYFGGDAKARIEIIPMIDVMMFLLVFFVLIMTEMIQGSGITLQLPASSTAQPLKAVTVTIGLARDGSLSLNGQSMRDDGVVQHLSQLQQTQAVNVVIAGDRQVPYARIVEVMDLARRAGIRSVGLATQS